MLLPPVASLAVLGVLSLITFLAYSSQILLLYLEPHPLERKQIIIFNVLVFCLLLSYIRSVRTNAGQIPSVDQHEDDSTGISQKLASKSRQRWCRRCEAVKPPRAHHCKVCKRCIPKMDHHCPWTANCVSHVTFPHFIRFLFYAVATMSYLEYFLYIRCAVIWGNKDLPSYFGPTIVQYVHLFLLISVNSLTLFVLTILLIRNIWCLTVNTTTIEGWEIERHSTLVRRARHFGGFLDGPDGIRVRIKRQEFPYDIGIWANTKQGMGTGNILAWFWPLSASPSIESGLTFEENGFEDPSISWPPPDPDRLQCKSIPAPRHGSGFTQDGPDYSAEESKKAFKLRQEADMLRWQRPEDQVQRRKPYVKRLEALQEPSEWSSDAAGDDQTSDSGEEGWRNSEGERLRDFGVDEDAEFYDEEDNIPLSELIARRKGR
ncbi:zf-DHHC-domain-containing protein [Mytilinidion resinicola]|uniref:Palmitoyltransferase PFA4 n=1 Tax=Mytilinidion resinicola TaxID=574789 RepID=A0A6A6YD24_9PEZI|nr:zf-DHHC-domain-containing protein [Mytilinidion resinicola]KAF2806610.1 zf-DHHC-domain-containing protein [Mytilinidion resinicola]